MHMRVVGSLDASTDFFESGFSVDLVPCGRLVVFVVLECFAMVKENTFWFFRSNGERSNALNLQR